MLAGHVPGLARVQVGGAHRPAPSGVKPASVSGCALVSEVLRITLYFGCIGLSGKIVGESCLGIMTSRDHSRLRITIRKQSRNLTSNDR